MKTLTTTIFILISLFVATAQAEIKLKFGVLYFR